MINYNTIMEIMLQGALSTVRRHMMIAPTTQYRTSLRAVMQRNRDSYRKCYERELLKNPSLAGTIAMEFVIQADGAVASASIASTTIGSPAVEQCVADAVKQLVFPPTQGGGSEKVSYPLVFVTNRP